MAGVVERRLRAVVSALIVALASPNAAQALPSADPAMRLFAVTCMGGVGYTLRHVAAARSNGPLGAFLDVAESDAVAVEVQRKFVGNRGVDDEETELIGLVLPRSIASNPSGVGEFSPERVQFALSDAMGRVDGTWKVRAERSRWKLSALSADVKLLSGTLSVVNERLSGEKALTVSVSCVIPAAPAQRRP